LAEGLSLKLLLNYYETEKVIMKKVFFILICLVFFTLGIGTVFGFRILQVNTLRSHRPVFSPQLTTFEALPPTDALVGEIIGLNGDVQKVARDQNGLQTISSSTTSAKPIFTSVLAGEEIITGNASGAIVQYKDFADIELSANSDVSFSNPLAHTFLVTQNNGTVMYDVARTLTDPKIKFPIENTATSPATLSLEGDPIGVRVDSALLSLYLGTAKITQQTTPDQIVIELRNGKAQLGLLNKNNDTKTWLITGNQRVVINNKSKTVEVKPL
jgi:hypothetical protein